MSIPTLLLLQAVAGHVLPLTPPPRSDAPCPTSTDPTEVIVCGRDQERFRLRPLPAEAERDGPPRAALRLGDSVVAAEVEQATLAGGQQSQRLMLRLRIPVGKGRR